MKWHDTNAAAIGAFVGVASAIGWMLWTSNFNTRAIPRGPVAAVCEHIPTFDEWYRTYPHSGWHPDDPPTNYEDLSTAIRTYGTFNYYLHECQNLEKMTTSGIPAGRSPIQLDSSSGTQGTVLLQPSGGANVSGSIGTNCTYQGNGVTWCQ